MNFDFLLQLGQIMPGDTIVDPDGTIHIAEKESVLDK